MNREDILKDLTDILYLPVEVITDPDFELDPGDAKAVIEYYDRTLPPPKIEHIVRYVMDRTKE